MPDDDLPGPFRIADVRSGELDRNDAAVMVQAYRALKDLVALERQVRETDELAAEIEEQTVALKRWSVAAVAVLLASIAAAVVLSGGTTKPAAAAVPGITVPPGFDSEVVYSGAPLSTPLDMLFDHSGNLLVSNTGPDDCVTPSGKIVSIAPDRSASVLVSGNGLMEPVGMAFGPGGAWDTSLYVADGNAGGGCAGQLFKFGSGGLSRFGDPGSPWGLGDPNDLAFGPGGAFGTDLYVTDCDRGGSCSSGDTGGGIYRVDPAGNKTVFHRGVPFVAPIDMEFGPGGAFGGDLYVADLGDIGPGSGSIYKVDSSGVPTLFASGSGSAFADPSAIAFAPGGVFGTDLYVHDRYSGDLYRIDPSGQTSTFATGLTQDTQGGNGIAFGPTGTDLYLISKGSIIRIFSTAPAGTTKPTTAATPSVEPNGAGWNKENVTVTLSATDNEGGSGVKEITYTINGGQPTTEQGDSVQVPVTAEGVNTISFHATDNAGNPEDEQAIDVKIDKTPPAVSSTSPASNATGVSATAKVSATFSESGSGIDPATLTAGTFKVAKVRPSGNVPVSGTVGYDVSSKTVTFTPSSSLAKGAYQATVTTGAEDKADNALANAYTWIFSTAGPSKK